MGGSLMSVSLAAGPRGVWDYRELLRSLVVRNLKVKYQRSVLGFVWTLLNPLLTVGVLVAVFTYVVRIRIENYWAFLLSGYFVWNFIQQSLSASTYVIAEHGQLSRSVAFPKEVLVLAAVASRLIEFAVELAIVLVLLCLLHHRSVPSSFLLLPLLVALQVLLTLALVFPIATLSVFYHDVQHALPIALATLFYLSPVFYSAALVPESIRGLYLANPIAALLTLYHTVVYDGEMPAATSVLAVALVTVAMIWAGYAVFNRYKRIFAEVV
jgi:ABC-type polysaccharide/polyol phosphate export permease